MTPSDPDGSGGTGWPPVVETPLDERIEVLTGMLDAPRSGVDVAELTGMLGSAWLELYERDGNEEAFAAGLARLGEVIAATPGHAHQRQWHFALGRGHLVRAESCGSAGDYDLAIASFTRLYGGLPADDPDRDQMAIMLIDLHWDRFWLLRYGAGYDPDAAVAEAERLVVAVDALPVGRRDPDAFFYAQMMAGLSHLERYEFSTQRPDLDCGIAMLAASLPDLPDGTPRQGLAGAELANAFRLRAVIEDDPASLDLSIAAGGRAIRRSSGADRMAWLMLHQNQALAHEMRWHMTGDRGDLDRAIACWRVLIKAQVGGPLDTWEAAHCGDLLSERGALTGKATDVAEAIKLLDRATQTPPDDPDMWRRWYELGKAYHLQWQLTQAAGSLEAVDFCLERTVKLSVPDR